MTEPEQAVRAIRLPVELLEQLLTEANPGAYITVHWGDPDSHGVYAPNFEITHIQTKVVHE